MGFAALDGHFVEAVIGLSPATSLEPAPVWFDVVVAAAAAVVAVLSVGPAKNLLSRHQRMNASFDPLHLVNTYGAFGSITRTRDEIVDRKSTRLNSSH